MLGGRPFPTKATNELKKQQTCHRPEKPRPHNYDERFSPTAKAGMTTSEQELKQKSRGE